MHVALQGIGDFYAAIGGLPQLDGAVIRAGGQQLPVRREGDGAHRVAIAFEAAQQRAIREIRDGLGRSTGYKCSTM